MFEIAKAEVLAALKQAFRGPSFRKDALNPHPEIGALMAKAGVTLDELVGEHTGFVSGTHIMPLMLDKAVDGGYSFFLWRPSMPANHEEWGRVRSPD